MVAKVYSYIRFSTDRQAEGASTDRQQDYADRWAEKNGFVLDATLSMRDEGLSAYHQKHISHGALGVFLRAVEDGRIEKGSVLVVEGLDRLSRAEPILAQAQMASIINHGVSVVTAGDGKVYSRESLKANPMDLVYSLLVMIRANEESETKSKRVSDAIRRQCIGWQSGAYRGMIRYGNTPGWLEVVDGKWQLNPERSDAIRSLVSLYLGGLGLGRIAQELQIAGLRPSDAEPTSGHLSRIVSQIALIGNKEIKLDGETYLLAGYYPAVIDMETWDALQQAVKVRGRVRERVTVRGEIPSILTGFGITHCGYCGAAMKAQTMSGKTRLDGSLADYNRRLQCTRGNSASKCKVGGSCSAAPIERVLFNFCADMINLRSLYPSDKSLIPKAELSRAEAHLAKIDKQLGKLTDVMIVSENDAPITFVRRARELEIERGKALVNVSLALSAVKDSAAVDLNGMDLKWRSLAKDVDSLDTAARTKARQLIADTFSKITIFHKGVDPTETTRGTIDVILQPKGGVARLLRVNKKGGWVAQEEISPDLLADTA